MFSWPRTRTRTAVVRNIRANFVLSLLADNELQMCLLIILSVSRTICSRMRLSVWFLRIWSNGIPSNKLDVIGILTKSNALLKYSLNRRWEVKQNNRLDWNKSFSKKMHVRLFGKQSLIVSCPREFIFRFLLLLFWDMFMLVLLRMLQMVKTGKMSLSNQHK